MDSTELTLRQYQTDATATDQVPLTDETNQEALMVPLLGLAGETGSLLSEFKKYLRQGDIYKPFEQQVTEELGDIL
ncbi:MAG: pyrophosphatase, partial [Roseobacter sp.]